MFLDLTAQGEAEQAHRDRHSMFVPEALWKRRGMPEIACGKSVRREVVKDPARPSGAILDRMHSAAVHTRIPKVLVPSCGQGLVIIRNGNLQDLVSARATDSDFHHASNTNSSPSSNAAATIDVPFSKLRKRRMQVSKRHFRTKPSHRGAAKAKAGNQNDDDFALDELAFDDSVLGLPLSLRS